MKALSLWQPHAAAIALGLKPFETRCWSTSHRGPLAIHAAKRPWNDGGTPEVEAWHNEAELRISNRCCDLLIERFPELANDRDRWKRAAQNLLDRVMVFGAVVCIADVTEDVPTHLLRGRIPAEQEFWGDFADGRQAFRLANVRLLDRPLAWRGQQGFFDVDLGAAIEAPPPAEVQSAGQLSLFGGQ